MKGSYNAALFFVIDNMLRTRVAQKNCAWTGHSLFLCLQQCVNVKRQIRRRADLIYKNIFQIQFSCIFVMWNKCWSETVFIKFCKL